MSSSAAAIPAVSHAATALNGEIHVPGDKSISHRALMLSSQVLGTSLLTGLLEGEDVINTAKALIKLGVSIEKLPSGAWRVHGVGVGGLQESAEVLDMGNSGTGARLMMGLLAPYPFTTLFTGDASLCSRPMKRVIAPLEQMGARFAARDGGRMPLSLTGSDIMLPLDYTLPMASAQVKSAILLAGLGIRGETSVTEPEPTRDHTENMMEYLGFTLKRESLAGGAKRVSLQGNQNPLKQDRVLDIPGDPSSAAFPMVAALLVPGSRISLKNICMNPLRIGLFTTLQEMGARLRYVTPRVHCGEEVADIEVEYSRLQGITVPAARAPSMIDEYPILAVAAAFAQGETRMEGLGELRVKESDRLQAILDGLAACGVKAWAEGDTLIVQGMREVPGGGNISTRLDHRIAMSFLVLGMAAKQPVQVDDTAPIATSFPGFTRLMNGLGARIAVRGSRFADEGGVEPLIIAIDGPAASGKGTLARRLAEHFGVRYLDTGGLYRAVGLKLEYGGKQADDREAAIAAAHNVTPEDLANPRLRQEHVGQAASVVSAMPEVRAALLDYQRRFAEGGAVLDGRDIGTIVMPGAKHKFYITASLEARAKRRHRELSGEGVKVDYDSVLEELRTRDARDATRAIAPMQAARDAVVIDTSDLSANEVFERIKNMVESTL